MLTIRERIIQAAATQLADITPANGYNTDVGVAVYRGRNDVTPDEVPCTVLFSFGDHSTTKQYGNTIYEFNIGVVSIKRFKTHNPSSESEKLLGDHVACLASPRISIPFTSGYREPYIGQYLTGNISNTQAVLESITLSTGSWAAHDAAGTFYLRLPDGDFTSELLLNVGSEVVASTTGRPTFVPPLSSLVSDIDYQESVVTNYPEPGEDVVKVTTTFTITYATLTGNPYKQGD